MSPLVLLLKLLFKLMTSAFFAGLSAFFRVRRNFVENFKKKSFTVLKYIAFGVVIGVLVGAIDTLFGRVLIAITDFRTDYYLFLLPFLPLAGLLITWMYNKYSAVTL